MSLLSQLVPQRGHCVLTIRIAGSGAPDMPTAAIPDGTASDESAGPCIGHASAVTLALLGDGSDGHALARLEAAVDERVDLWTPALHTTSRFELVSTIANIDDAITDVTVTFTDSITAGSTTLLTWLATGRFSHPAFLDDDHLIEPSGAVIRVAGAISVSCTAGHRAERIRCYYDRLGIIEQLIGANRPGARR
jgi:hypothetical protein